jgi:YidC/Oxa1 family membrane protein insertase
VIAWAPWQALLNGLGWVLAQIYGVVGNLGVTIIILTLVIRLILLPLGIKQVRSMQHMQLVQPKVKQIQQKYKQNRQRQQEEIMKVYKEYGVNPFSGCWPVLLQFPILIAMYSVLRFPQHPIHVPAESELYAVVTEQIPPVQIDEDSTAEEVRAQVPDEPGPVGGGVSFLGMNLLCSPSNAGNEDATLGDRVTVRGETVPLEYPVNCGGDLNRIPYYVFVAAMFGTTYFQQRQMQKASPPGAASSQQQAILRILPITFGVFGIFFPAGLVVYWTTSNLWQIGQQYYMLRTRPTTESLAAAAANGKPERKGIIASMMARAQEERDRRQTGTARPGTTRKPGSGRPGSSTQRRKPGSGGSGGGDPKKRPKR